MGGAAGGSTANAVAAGGEALSGMHFKKRKLAAMMYCAPHTVSLYTFIYIYMYIYIQGLRTRLPRVHAVTPVALPQARSCCQELDLLYQELNRVARPGDRPCCFTQDSSGFPLSCEAYLLIPGCPPSSRESRAIWESRACRAPTTQGEKSVGFECWIVKFV